MFATYSSAELHVTAMWSTHPIEDEVILIDHDDTDKGSFPEYNRALVTHWEELTKEAHEEGVIAVGQLNSGKAFEIEPLLDIIRLSRVEAQMKEIIDGTE